MQVSGYGNTYNQSSYGAGQASSSNYTGAAGNAGESSAEAVALDSSGDMGYQDGYSLDISPEAWAAYRGG